MDKKVSTHPHIQKPIEFYSKDFFLDSDETVKLNQIYRSEGERYIFILLLEIFHHTFLYSNERSNANVVFICDEIENRLHPKYQKYIPIFLAEFEKYCFNDILKNRNVSLQFLISTHSPFIISEAGKIAEEERAKGEKPSQKVYLIEGGQCKESKGFIGSKVKNQVAKMLGAGLGDLSNVEPKTNINSPIIVLCEGKTDNNSVEDSVFYNEIFRDKFPSVLFISCEGQGSITSNFYNFSNFKDNVSGNFNLYSLKDRDLKFTDQELKDEIIKHPNIKYTKNRFIECYIYNEITAKLYAKLKSLKLVDNKLSELQNFIAKIQIKASNKDENGQNSKQIKNKLKNLFKETLNESEISFNSNFMKEIGELIRFNKEGDSNKIYNELYNCIFGSSIKDELEKA